MSVLSFTVTIPPVVTLPARGSRLQMFMMWRMISSSEVATVALIQFVASTSRAERFGIAEFAVRRLRRDRLPHIPGFALAVFNAGQIGRVGLIAVAGGIGAAAVGDEYQIVLDQVDGLGSRRP